MFDIIGNILIVISLVFIILGEIGLYRFKNFYSRILISSNIDSAGFILLMAGVICKFGFSWFSLKVFVISVIFLVINPVVSHFIVRSAHLSGYKIDEE